MKKITRLLFRSYSFDIISMIIIFILCIILPVIILPGNLNAEEWIKVDGSCGEPVWIDTSHWENIQVYVSDGYYRDVAKKRWIDDSYMVNQGYWKTGQHRVWVEEKKVVSYTAYRYVDTSHRETRYKYIKEIRPVNFTVIYGTDSYGWNVYSFAAKAAGMEQVYYYGEKYLAQKWVIDYNPYRGGRIYAVKYVFLYKFETIKQSYSIWVSSGYWQPYTDYMVVDNSHWETRTGRFWVDTSYMVQTGHWEEYVEKEWVETGHYENRSIWVKDGYYAEPLHGKIMIEKSPRYIFTRWHKSPDGRECDMQLRLRWEIYSDPDGGQQNQPGKEIHTEIRRINIFEDVKRYNGYGIDKVVIYDENISPASSGYLETTARFDHAGSEESILHIYLYGEGSRMVHVYFSNPVNGFRSMNIDYDGTGTQAGDWLGGNMTGEVEF